VKNKKFIFWAPRVLAIIFILFLSLFALDVFEPGRLIPEMIAGFLIHLIPCYILVAVLVISWKRELFGTVVFTLLGILYIIFAVKGAGLMGISWSVIISGPLFLIAFLFYKSQKYKAKNKKR
jgi:hypothetical protein